MIDQELLNRLAKYCAYSERCAFDVHQKASKIGIDKPDIPLYIDWLTNEQFINEHRYVHAYVNDKIIFSKWGLSKIQHELATKQIYTDIRLLYQQHTKWHEPYTQNIKTLIEKKTKQLNSEMSSFTKEQKIHAYLYQRGFEHYEYTLDL